MKLCDFGLARSIAGVESAAMILSQKYKDEENKNESDESEVKSIGVNLSKISINDNQLSPHPVDSEEKKKEDLK